MVTNNFVTISPIATWSTIVGFFTCPKSIIIIMKFQELFITFLCMLRVKEKKWLTNGQKGCLLKLKRALMMKMGKSCFYMELWSNLFKLWKMKGIGMVLARWGMLKIYEERRSLGVNIRFWRILLLHQYIWWKTFQV